MLKASLHHGYPPEECKHLVENDPSTKKNQDFSTKKNAVESLCRTGDVSAVEALERLLTDKSESYRLRWRAARALGEIADQSAVDVISEALNDKNQVVRWEAVVALGKIGGSTAIVSLMKSISDESYCVRRRAAQVLIELDGIPQPSPFNLEYLIKLLGSGDDRVKETIIKIGAPALATLTTALKDDSFFIRRDVAQTLALFFRGIIGDRPKAMDLDFCLAKHNFSLKSIARLFDLRITWEKSLVKKVETTNFEAVSKKLRGIEILELSSIEVPGLEVLRSWRKTEAKPVDLENILSESGAVNLEAKGRTLTANLGKGYLAIKLGARSGDGDKLLVESIIQNYLDRHGIDLRLSSRFPHPFPMKNLLQLRIWGSIHPLLTKIFSSSDKRHLRLQPHHPSIA
ncbi:MAG: HEAT repeat domain-containing protein, partial [Methanotrichaceae archaeon]